MQQKKFSEQFVDYLVESGKTKLTMDMVFEEFKASGFYKKCLDNIPPELEKVLGRWDDNRWSAYIYNFAKMKLGIRAALGEKELGKIIS